MLEQIRAATNGRPLPRPSPTHAGAHSGRNGLPAQVTTRVNNCGVSEGALGIAHQRENSEPFRSTPLDK